jgi:hypothetical protein
VAAPPVTEGAWGYLAPFFLCNLPPPFSFVRNAEADSLSSHNFYPPVK